MSNAAKKQNCKLIHISTDYVFDGLNKNAYSEEDITNPINVYGQSKLDGEKAIQNTMKFNAIIIRTSWVYSEFENNFVDTMLRLGQNNDELNAAREYRRVAESGEFDFEHSMVLYRKSIIHLAHAEQWKEAVDLLNNQPPCGLQSPNDSNFISMYPIKHQFKKHQKQRQC